MSTSRVLVIINILVFAAWQFATSSRANFYFMAENFLVSWTALVDGRYWTLITSVFSHNAFLHLLFNMMVLDGFGPVVESVLGRKSFLKFYFLAGVLSSFSHAAVSLLLLHNPDLPALGASGAISGIIFLFALFFPTQKILIFGFVPTPAIWGALFFVGIDIWGLVAQAEGGGLPIGHGAHLGGAATGVLYYLYYRNKRKAFRSRSDWSS